MVFGAMTQANGFETGFSLNNVKWTGDYWISQESYIQSIDINPNGSNIFYISWLNTGVSAVNNICTLSLGSTYQLSSNIAMPIRIPSSNLAPAPASGVGGLRFHSDNGNILYYTTNQQVSNTWVNDPFIIPSIFQPSSNTFLMNTPVLNSTFVHSSDNVYAAAFISSQNFPVQRGFLGMNKSTRVGFNINNNFLLSNYNSGGFHGATSDKKMDIIIVLSGLNITSNTWLLSKMYITNKAFNAFSTSTKYDFTNIYPLFPANMKPTRASGIVVDKQNAQYLFINALINNKWTICKFQLRAT